MKTLLFSTISALFLLFATPHAHAADAPKKPLHHFMEVDDHSSLSLAYDWCDVAEEVIAKEHEVHAPRPTIGSRMFAIWATSMFDAWAAYDDKAVGSRLGGTLRRPPAERTLENKKKAISYASYRALLFDYPEAKGYLDEQMKKFGYDPANQSVDPATPEGVGNIAAQAVIDYRRHDGSNQFGDEVGGDGTPYGDYTYYVPFNPPDKIIDPDRWQPITFTVKDGKKVTPNFLTPHWYRVKPFAMENSTQFRPGPPPKTTTANDVLRKEADQVLDYNAHLTKEQKALVEFMREGPRSTGQSGHWMRFAQDVSRRDHHTLDEDVKLYFAVANVAFDAFISCWETKRYYDTSRPWTLIHYYHKGETLTGWAGPHGGTKQMPAEQWCPYSPEAFITPPFPGYTSGHATVSGASSKIIELFTGSDTYGYTERRRHCELTEDMPGDYVTLDMPTWTSVAEMAALSRALGGYHIPNDNNVGLKVGRELAVYSWPKYQEYFNGTAKVRD